MPPSRRDVSTLVFAAALAPIPARAQLREPLVIARGGAVGDAPEATLGAYDQAIRDGADFLEATLAVSKDGVLVVRRDNELSITTDIATRAEFSGRRATRMIGGVERSGWFAEDFTLAELKTLICGPVGARRGRGETPPAILTFQEVIDTARVGCVRTARVIGVYAALPQPAYFAGLGLALEPRVAEAIRKGGYDALAAAMIVISADREPLRALTRLTRVRRVLRLGSETTVDLAGARAVAHGVAPDLTRIVDATTPRRPTATTFVAQAHAAGLFVHAWAAPADPQALMETAYAGGVDAVSADLSRVAVKARAKTTTSENRET